MRKVSFKVVMLTGETVTRRHAAPRGTRFTREGIDHLLTQEAARVEQYIPGHEFRLVPMRDGGFNFIEIPAEMVNAGETA
jgi:hypothetical protein